MRFLWPLRCPASQGHAEFRTRTQPPRDRGDSHVLVPTLWRVVFQCADHARIGPHQGTARLARCAPGDSRCRVSQERLTTRPGVIPADELGNLHLSAVLQVREKITHPDNCAILATAMKSACTPASRARRLARRARLAAATGNSSSPAVICRASVMLIVYVPTPQAFGEK